MPEFEKFKMDFQEAKKAFENGVLNLKTQFQEQQKQETGHVSLDDGYINKQPVDWSLYYCITETMEQCERAIKEKPSREMSIVKTKLQEATFWLNEAK